MLRFGACRRRPDCRNVADEEVPELGPVPTRIEITEETVRRLVAAQFPQWADLPIHPLASQGWDNQSFRLGTTRTARLPSAEPYALAVGKERRWLPVLAPQLPLAIPVPLAEGAPDRSYPFRWSVYRWLDGEPASRENITDLTEFAAALADFLVALQRVDPTGGPAPGLHNWYRGGTLATYDGLARQALVTLENHCHTDLAREIWETALPSRWEGPPVWFHGDVARGNLLVNDGALSAVIDFGTCGVGDPACDLAIAWTLLTDESRRVFRDRLRPDDDAWDRGRGWALWKSLVTCAGELAEGGPDLAESMVVLEEIFEEYLTTRAEHDRRRPSARR